MGTLVDGITAIQSVNTSLKKKQKDFKGDKDKLAAVTMSSDLIDSYNDYIKKMTACMKILEDLKKTAGQLAKLSKSCIDDDDNQFDAMKNGCYKVMLAKEVNPYLS